MFPKLLSIISNQLNNHRFLTYSILHFQDEFKEYSVRIEQQKGLFSILEESYLKQNYYDNNLPEANQFVLNIFEYPEENEQYFDKLIKLINFVYFRKNIIGSDGSKKFKGEVISMEKYFYFIDNNTSDGFFIKTYRNNYSYCS
jgi:hypothetical protein